MDEFCDMKCVVEGDVIHICIPEKTPTLNKWQRMHFRVKEREVKKFAMYLLGATAGKFSKPIKKCTMHVKRYSSRTPDWDNLYGGLKPLLDAMVVPTSRNPNGIGIIEDDNPDIITGLIATPLECKPKQGKTVITILRLDLSQP